jgi:hypothetical protein
MYSTDYRHALHDFIMTQLLAADLVAMGITKAIISRLGINFEPVAIHERTLPGGSQRLADVPRLEEVWRPRRRAVLERVVRETPEA